MTKSERIWAIRLHEYGSAEKLNYEATQLAEPNENQVQLQIHACGVNFIDIYQRQGLYKMDLPAICGNEAVGSIIKLGKKVSKWQLGDRVGFCSSGDGGGYATRTNVNQTKLVALPDELDFATAGAILLKGLTAEYLARRCWPIRVDDPVLVTAAAGGVGQILCNWLTSLGAKVVGLVGSKDKLQLAQQTGCIEVLVGYQDIAARVRKIFPSGVWAAFDSVGKDTFNGCLEAIMPRGCMISYGNASGVAPAIKPLELAHYGSIFLTRPVLKDYVASGKELQAAAQTLFNQIHQGLLLPKLNRWKLAEAAVAQRALEDRNIKGIAVLECAHE